MTTRFDPTSASPWGSSAEPLDRPARRDPAAASQPPMERRTAVMLVALFAVVLFAALAMLLPVPYAVYSPGPVVNTLGEVGGKPLISITGRKTYPTKGQLDMTTVRLSGGPGNRVDLAHALYAWLDPSSAVLPEETVFPPGQTEEESRQQDQAMMTTSQESATAAALAALGIPVPTTLSIAGVQQDSPAAVTIEKDDVLLEAQGQQITDLARLRTALSSVQPGSEVDLVVRRDGARRELSTRTIASQDGRTLLGVFIDPEFRFPFMVQIEIEKVVGPSAGMMFALGIIDRLTEGDLTGGRHVAGTGTIEADGTVGPIGGIHQKLVGARNAGAEYFLAPAGNCDAVVGNVPDDLTVVKVATLSEAMSAVETIAAGRASSLPRC